MDEYEASPAFLAAFGLASVVVLAILRIAYRFRRRAANTAFLLTATALTLAAIAWWADLGPEFYVVPLLAAGVGIVAFFVLSHATPKQLARKDPLALDQADVVARFARRRALAVALIVLAVVAGGIGAASCAHIETLSNEVLVTVIVASSLLTIVPLFAISTVLVCPRCAAPARDGFVSAPDHCPACGTPLR